MDETAYSGPGQSWMHEVFVPPVAADEALVRPEAAEDLIDRIRDEVLRHFHPADEEVCTYQSTYQSWIGRTK